jgi:two-component system response regulator (stage 0 sporulation protein F)
MKIKILIVDDESDVEFLFKSKFRKQIKEEEIELFFAFSGEDAFDLLLNMEHPNVALILSDINMPGISGFELLEKIKAKFPQIRVMMITAYGDPENKAKAIELGADDLLSKPLDFALLEEKLRNLSND